MLLSRKTPSKWFHELRVYSDWQKKVANEMARAKEGLVTLKNIMKSVSRLNNLSLDGKRLFYKSSTGL